MKLNGEKNAALDQAALDLGYALKDKRCGDIGDVWIYYRWCDGSKHEPRGGHHAYLVRFESDQTKELCPISFSPLDAITTEQFRVQHCFDYAEAHFGVKYAETTLH